MILYMVSHNSNIIVVNADEYHVEMMSDLILDAIQSYNARKIQKFIR